MKAPQCGNPDHNHGRNRAEVLINLVLSMPEIGHGGYIVYEVQGEELLIIGDRLTSGNPEIEAVPRYMVPLFLGATAETLERIYDYADPGWTEGEDGRRSRPVGLMVKHRAGALGIRRFRPASQGVILALRDMSFRFGCTERHNRLIVWTHRGRHLPEDCLCGQYLDAVEAIFPTCREAVLWATMVTSPPLNSRSRNCGALSR